MADAVSRRADRGDAWRHLLVPVVRASTLRPSASNTRRLFWNSSVMRPGDARLISPSSIQNFHSLAGTLISAFGKAFAVVGSQPAVHVVRMEM